MGSVNVSEGCNGCLDIVEIGGSKLDLRLAWLAQEAKALLQGLASRHDLFNKQKNNKQTLNDSTMNDENRKGKNEKKHPPLHDRWQSPLGSLRPIATQ